MTNLTQIDLTRQDMLQIWLKRNGITQVSLARKLKVTESTMSMMLKRQTISSFRYVQLVKLGLPRDLLPPIEDKTPGPKPKNMLALPAAT